MSVGSWFPVITDRLMITGGSHRSLGERLSFTGSRLRISGKYDRQIHRSLRKNKDFSVLWGLRRWYPVLGLRLSVLSFLFSAVDLQLSMRGFRITAAGGRLMLKGCRLLSLGFSSPV